MADTNIGWTDKVWNPTVGCSRVSAGCERCYAETFANRLEGMGQERYKGLTVIGKHGARWTGEVRQVPEVLAAPLTWRKGRRVFVNSMSDLFHEAVPFEYVAAVFGVMAACPQHTFQVLTKRPERALKFFEWIEDQGRELLAQVNEVPPSGTPVPAACAVMANMSAPLELISGDAWRAATGASWPLSNVHLGVSCEDQAAADKRIPLLLRCPAAVRWISYEPALGPLGLFTVDEDGEFGPGWHLTHVEHLVDYGTGTEHDVDAQVAIDWVIVGGESGADHRPVDPAWIDSIVAQCVGVEVPVFVKQDSGPKPGRKGRLSDATWSRKEFPQ